MSETANSTPFEILLSVTQEQLEQIAAVIGVPPERISRLVMADNNIAAFHHEGPDILKQFANALPDDESRRLKSWDELDMDTRQHVVGMAAGGVDYATNKGHIDAAFINDTLAGDPGLKAALLNPCPATRPNH